MPIKDTLPRLAIKVQNQTIDIKFKDLKKVKTIPCPRCGAEISIYYFTAIKKENGTIVPTKCKNCGYYEEPE